MRNYIIKRLLTIIPTLLGISIVIFLIMGLMIGLMSLAGDSFDLSGLPLRIPAWTLTLAAAGLFALSWAVSVRIYEKKEIG